MNTQPQAFKIYMEDPELTFDMDNNQIQKHKLPPFLKNRMNKK